MSIALSTKNLSIHYGTFKAVNSVNMDFEANEITAIIGPSGCGKSTALRSFNRMNELIPGTKVEGEVIFQGTNIYASEVDPVELRSRIGMVFQKPNPFPKSVFQNIVWGAKINGIHADHDQLVEESLKAVALWDEVKDKLKQSANSLSGGQQQRLCIARAIAIRPDILLMDEPTSALDPISTSRIEDLMDELKKKYTIIIVTHNMQQAARISDRTAFFLNGDMIEFGLTKDIFYKPRDTRTENYISGRFG